MKLIQIYEDVMKQEFYHGTSDFYEIDIKNNGLSGYRGVYLTTDYGKAEYYADQVSSARGGNPIIYRVNVIDSTKLRVDSNELEDPVATSDHSIDELESIIKDASKNYVKKYPKSYDRTYGFVDVDETHYWFSLNTTKTVMYDGKIPSKNVEIYE
tara:strand:- start:4920 stop:5384 length:465 start_codon:yes stop_codon:yes gene_type:complete